jgi:diguanylate cyclase
MPGKAKTTRNPVMEKAEAFISQHHGTTSPHLEAYKALLGEYGKLFAKFDRVLTISDKYGAQLKETTHKLNDALSHINQLKDIFLPICMFCKKIRIDDNYWERIESYFAKHIDIAFSHGICPDCAREKYGGIITGTKLREKLFGNVAEESKQRAQNIPSEDLALSTMKDILADPSMKSAPFYDDIRQFSEKYRKLLVRLNKIVVISDSYQAQLRALNTSLEMTARTDMMTGLSNRWDMFERIEIERSRAERHGRPFSLVLMDIDFFKQVNDTYGHEAGDRVILETAQMLRENIRKEDLCARWGGEEFLVLLPETGLPRAVQTGERFLDEARRRVVRCDDHEIRFTMSAGVTESRKGLSVDDCIREADRGLYAAKEGGRDRLMA